MSKKIKDEELQKEIIDFAEWWNKQNSGDTWISYLEIEQYIKNQLWRNRSF